MRRKARTADHVNLLRRTLPLALFLLTQGAAALALDVDAPDEIGELLEPYLPEDEQASPARLRQLSSEILATEGYFAPKIEIESQDTALRLRIDPGPRTLVEHVDIAVDGPLTAESRAALIADWKLPAGQAFRQNDWNEAKQHLLATLLAERHAGARLIDSQAMIDPEVSRAALKVHYDAGPIYRFGELRVEGLKRYTPELIARYNREVTPGTPYSEARLGALQNTLQATPYFASVQVEMERDTAPDANGEVSAPVVLRVRERPAHRLSFGMGASSNTGARIEANYHTPDLFKQAWELDTGLRLEQKKQTAYADIFFPPDDKARRHSVGAMAEGTDIQGLRTERFGFGAQRVQQRGSLEQRLSINWQEERRKPDGALETTSRALVPNVQWTWRKVDSLLNPQHGIVLQAQVGAASKTVLSERDFVRLHSRVQYFIPLGKVDTLTLRGEIGYTIADSRQGIPQDYLFRTGGTGTVRGYAYQSLGVREGSAVVGGRYLGVVSAEATHWLDESWGIAAFVDAGDAVDALQKAKLALGYGLGARWRSPAGPIGIDLAYGQRTAEFQLHFSLAIPF